MPKAALKRRFETWVDLPRGDIGTVTVRESERTFIEIWFGKPDVVARRLEKDGFPGLGGMMRSSRGPIAYIAGMEVDREDRRRGVGTVLLELALKELRALGVRRVFLHRAFSVEMPDGALARFYERAGFRDAECCGDDFWPVMERRLPAPPGRSGTR